MLKNFRRSYWLFTGFVSKHKGKILLTALATAVGITILPQLAQKIPTGKPTQRIGRVGQYSLEKLPPDIEKRVSQGLTGIGEDGTASPSLAMNWNITDDGKRYVFTLNPDIQWHDGQTIQAAHIIYDLQDVETNIVSSNMVEFKLKEPFAPFPTALASPLFRKTTSISRLLKRQKSELLGTGEFQIKTVIRRGQYILQLDLESLTQKLRYKFYPSETSAMTAYKLGEVDYLEEITNPKVLKDWQNTHTTENVHTDRYVAVFFNTQDALLADKNFRQALTYAIPNKDPGGHRALGPLNPNSWAYNPQVKPYKTDLKRAKELITKIKAEDKEFNPTIRLDTTLAYLDTAEKIKQAWADIGVNSEVRVITYPPSEYQALLIAHQIPADPDQYTLWHSTQKDSNITKLINPKIDKLLEDGRRTMDQEQREQIYFDFQRFLLEESPAAFLFHPSTYTIFRK